MPLIQKPYRQETSEDIKRMQQDAIKRVHEMQKRAKITLEQSKVPPLQTIPDPPTFPKPENNTSNKKNFDNKKSQENSSSRHKKNNFINNLPSLVEPLFKDKEKSLILILIFILMGEKEEGNLEIILVLFYILYA